MVFKGFFITSKVMESNFQKLIKSFILNNLQRRLLVLIRLFDQLLLKQLIPKISNQRILISFSVRD